MRVLILIALLVSSASLSSAAECTVGAEPDWPAAGSAVTTDKGAGGLAVKDTCFGKVNKIEIQSHTGTACDDATEIKVQIVRGDTPTGEYVVTYEKVLTWKDFVETDATKKIRTYTNKDADMLLPDGMDNVYIHLYQTDGAAALTCIGKIDTAVNYKTDAIVNKKLNEFNTGWSAPSKDGKAGVKFYLDKETKISPRCTATPIMKICVAPTDPFKATDLHYYAKEITTAGKKSYECREYWYGKCEGEAVKEYGGGTKNDFADPIKCITSCQQTIAKNSPTPTTSTTTTAKP